MNRVRAVRNSVSTAILERRDRLVADVRVQINSATKVGGPIRSDKLPTPPIRVVAAEFMFCRVSFRVLLQSGVRE
jgi:hypothetical protein